LLEDYLLLQHQLRQLQGLATAAELALPKTEATESGSQGASAASSHSAALLLPNSTIVVAHNEAHATLTQYPSLSAGSASVLMPDEAAALPVLAPVANEEAAPTSPGTRDD